MNDIESMNSVRRRRLTPAYPTRPRRQRGPLGMARVFAITSGKGGVGKTNVTANLATALAHSRLVVEEVKDAPSAQAFGAVAGRLIESAEVGGRMKGNLQFFFWQVLEGIEGAR